MSLVNNLEALDATEPYDVCILGSGPAGTVVGTTLAERGVRVLILESGNTMASWLFNENVKKLAEYEFSGDANYPTTRTAARLVGGKFSNNIH